LVTVFSIARFGCCDKPKLNAYPTKDITDYWTGKYMQITKNNRQISTCRSCHHTLALLS